MEKAVKRSGSGSDVLFLCFSWVLDNHSFCCVWIDIFWMAKYWQVSWESTCLLVSASLFVPFKGYLDSPGVAPSLYAFFFFFFYMSVLSALSFLPWSHLSCLYLSSSAPGIALPLHTENYLGRLPMAILPYAKIWEERTKKNVVRYSAVYLLVCRITYSFSYLVFLEAE
jgi:hypothetical protein